MLCRNALLMPNREACLVFLNLVEINGLVIITVRYEFWKAVTINFLVIWITVCEYEFSLNLAYQAATWQGISVFIRPALLVLALELGTFYN